MGSIPVITLDPLAMHRLSRENCGQSAAAPFFLPQQGAAQGAHGNGSFGLWNAPFLRFDDPTEAFDAMQALLLADRGSGRLLRERRREVQRWYHDAMAEGARNVEAVFIKAVALAQDVAVGAAASGRQPVSLRVPPLSLAAAAAPPASLPVASAAASSVGDMAAAEFRSQMASRKARIRARHARVKGREERRKRVAREETGST